MLAEHPTHGYELLESLGCFGFDGSDQGGVYRALRAMESEGLVASSWHHSSAGPYRRVYELTPRGLRELGHGAEHVASAEAILVDFLDRYRCVCEPPHAGANGNGAARESKPSTVPTATP